MISKPHKFESEISLTDIQKRRALEEFRHILDDLQNQVLISFDLETSGLPKEMPDDSPYPYLAEFGMVPFRVKDCEIYVEEAFVINLKIPSVEQMKKEGKVSTWNLNRPSSLEIYERSYRDGISVDEARVQIKDYFERIRPLFGVDKKGEPRKPTVMGKSLSALDWPMMWHTFGPKFIDEVFHHQTIEINGMLNFLMQIGMINTLSMEKLADQYLGHEIDHTSIGDCVTAAKLKIYFVQAFLEAMGLVNKATMVGAI